jgi:glycosyltransferase involved in cell wall biosynthesis
MRTPGVELVGQVPDVRPYLERAAVVVVPLHIAPGVQNKILEALAMARAVVASPGALTGLRAEPGVQALSASTPREWADAVGGLLEDEAMRHRLGADGRRYVEEHHRWERCLEPLGPLLDLPKWPGGCTRASSSLATDRGRHEFRRSGRG